MKRWVKARVNDKSPSELPNEFYAVPEQPLRQDEHKETSASRRGSCPEHARLSYLCTKQTTRHGNNKHSVMIKEPQFDTRPSGPILVSFLMQERKEEQNKSNVQRSTGTASWRCPKLSRTPPGASRRRDDETTRYHLRSGRDGMAADQGCRCWNCRQGRSHHSQMRRAPRVRPPSSRPSPRPSTSSPSFTLGQHPA